MARKPRSDVTFADVLAPIIDAEEVTSPVERAKPATPLVEVVEHPLQGLTYEDVIHNLKEMSDAVFVDTDASLADVCVVTDMHINETLEMTLMIEGEAAAQRVAMAYAESCLPYIKAPAPPRFKDMRRRMLAKSEG